MFWRIPVRVLVVKSLTVAISVLELVVDVWEEGFTKLAMESARNCCLVAIYAKGDVE